MDQVMTLPLHQLHAIIAWHQTDVIGLYNKRGRRISVMMLHLLLPQAMAVENDLFAA